MKHVLNLVLASRIATEDGEVGAIIPAVDATDQPTVTMVGPLSEVYAKALMQVLSKDNPQMPAVPGGEEAVSIVMESQAMDVVLLGKLAQSLAGANVDDPLTSSKIYSVHHGELTDQTIVDVTSELTNYPQDAVEPATGQAERQQGDFVLIIDGMDQSGDGTPGGEPAEKLHQLGTALECLVTAHGGKVYHSLKAFAESV